MSNITDIIAEYEPGQWWLGELESFAARPDATPDQKRAVATAIRLFRAVFAARPAADADDLRDMLALIHDNGYAIGDRLQRLSGNISLRLKGEHPEPHVIREQAFGVEPEPNNAAVAVIAFVLESGDADDGMTFLRLWNEGEFDACRREWPEAPDAVYIGADQFFVPRTRTSHDEKDTNHG